MKAIVKLIKIYDDSRLRQVIILGDEDSGSRIVSVSYKHATIDDLESIKSFSSSIKKNIINQIVDKEDVVLEDEAWNLPAKLGITELKFDNFSIEIE